MPKAKMKTIVPLKPTIISLDDDELGLHDFLILNVPLGKVEEAIQEYYLLDEDDQNETLVMWLKYTKFPGMEAPADYLVVEQYPSGRVKINGGYPDIPQNKDEDEEE